MIKLTGEQMAYALRWAARYLEQHSDTACPNDSAWDELNYCAGKFEEDYQRSINPNKNPADTANIELKLAEDAPPEATIKCWLCEKLMTIKERSNNDGDCIHCGVEIQLGNVE